MKIIKIFLIIIALIIVFNKKIISYYYVNKFSKWVERPVKIDSVRINYSGLIEIEKIQITNLPKSDNKNIFEAEKIILVIDLKSLFSNLVVIKKLDIISPKFFLELNILKNQNNFEKKDEKIIQQNGNSIYNDNIGLAKKINENTPDKIWPKKDRDKNFIILKSELSNAKVNINVSSISRSTETYLSKMKFKNFGNEKNYKHYKDILKFILFDAYASTKDKNIKRILKDVYKF